MPIEDIQYLLNNSERDSQLLFIDSSARDISQYPYPSEYAIDFEEPFTNVYGIEIIDALIPSTMYNVESFNNHLQFSIFRYHGLVGSKVTSQTDVEAADAMIQAYMAELQASNAFVRRFQDTTVSSYLVVTDDTINVPNGVQDGSVPIYWFQRTLVYDEEKRQWVPSYKEHMIDSVTFQSIIAPPTASDVAPHVFGVFYNIVSELETGNYDVTSLVTTLSDKMCGLRLPYQMGVDTSTFGIYSPTNNVSDITKQMRFVFRIDDQPYVRILINQSLSTIAPTIGFGIKRSPNSLERMIKLTHWTSSEVYMGVSTYISNSGFAHNFQPPGIFNLISNVRYMLLRCPEIESHLFNSFAYGKFCPGIALFKHTGNNELNNFRFDFTNFIKKPIHPIGKLRRLTLQFKLHNDTFYDFKGVDHIMLLAIKFYVPKHNASPGSDSYRLNPNYNPNYIEYMCHQISSRQHNDDHEDDDVNEALQHTLTPTDYETKRAAMAKQLIARQNEYDYSSEEDFDGGDDDECDEVTLVPSRIRRFPS